MDFDAVDFLEFCRPGVMWRYHLHFKPQPGQFGREKVQKHSGKIPLTPDVVVGEEEDILAAKICSIGTILFRSQFDLSLKLLNLSPKYIYPRKEIEIKY